MANILDPVCIWTTADIEGRTQDHSGFSSLSLSPWPRNMTWRGNLYSDCNKCNKAHENVVIKLDHKTTKGLWKHWKTAGEISKEQRRMWCLVAVQLGWLTRSRPTRHTLFHLHRVKASNNFLSQITGITGSIHFTLKKRLSALKWYLNCRLCVKSYRLFLTRVLPVWGVGI